MANFNGGNDDDTFVGGIDPDQVKGGGGNDILFGLSGRDRIEGEAGDDILDGGADDDFLVGGVGKDRVSGGGGDDFIYSALLNPDGSYLPDRTAEADVLLGGSGDDVISAGYGDSIDGGDNGSQFGVNDRLLISFMGALAGVTADFRILATTPGATMTIGATTITNIERVEYLEGSDFGDTLAAYGSFFGSTVYGRGGNDQIFVLGESGPLYGGEGDDTIDTTGGSGFADAYGEAGNDVIVGGNNNGTLYGGVGNDQIETRNGNARGGDGDDLITDKSLFGALMMGEAGNDTIVAGATNDYAYGGSGDDRLYFGPSLTDFDVANGEEGYDRLILQGDYSSGVTLTESNVLQVEEVDVLSSADNSFGGGGGVPFSYRIVTRDDVVAAGGLLTIDAGGLAAGETLTFDASADTNSRFNITGGAGNDDLTGGAGADSFFLQRGGNDRAIGGGGSDGFFFGAALSGLDVVDGGTGADTVALQGNYAAGLTLTGITNVEFLSLLTGANTQFGEPGSNRYSYALTTVDANVAAGATLTVQATGLLATENLTFNGAAETNGNFRVFAGQGVDTLTGGAGSDGFFFGADGNLTGADRIDGGAGTDSVALRGNYVVALQDATFVNVEVLALLSGHSNEYGGAIVAGGYDYDVTLANGNLAAGKSLDVVGSNLRADESLRLDGRAETDGSLRLFGGAGDDTLYGGSQGDTLFGGLGQDRLEGGAGADIYAYQSAAQSTSSFYDMITGFDWNVDRIDAPGSTVRSFSQSAQGSLSTASFDADLTARMSGVLGANQAALFTANAGTLSGHIFAVIDVNGQAGYQAGQDLVIELINPVLPIDPTAGVII